MCSAAFLRPILAALLALAAACGHDQPTAPEGDGPLGKFDRVWQDYDEHYAYFELGNFDWAAMGARYRARISASTSDHELATIIGGMIGELRDYHADITTPFGILGPPPVPYEHHYSAVLMQGMFAAPLRATASRHIQYTTLPDGTGYIYIGSFEGEGWGDEVMDAIGALSPAAIVLDIRDNGGGNEAVGAQVASHLYDQTRVYRTARFRTGPGHSDFGASTSFSVSPAPLRFTGPVALLTNRYNGSASEDFTLMLRILPGVVTVGDTTLGVGSNPLRMSLSNGWSYRIPQSIQQTPDGVAYQWRGLPPAMPVAWLASDTAAGHDPYIDAAVQELRRRRGLP